MYYWGWLLVHWNRCCLRNSYGNWNRVNRTLVYWNILLIWLTNSCHCNISDLWRIVRLKSLNWSFLSFECTINDSRNKNHADDVWILKLIERWFLVISLIYLVINPSRIIIIKNSIRKFFYQLFIFLTLILTNETYFNWYNIL